MNKMAVGFFKGYCLAVVDEVQAKRQTIVITRHGKPVAKLVSADQSSDDIYNFVAAWVLLQAMSFPRDFRRRLGRTQVILVDTDVVVWLAFDQGQPAAVD
jgi:antitoxin (DNA-binding transcriptional repressor) of toxin-antitoxin stability system